MSQREAGQTSAGAVRGRAAEDRAFEYLGTQGLSLVARNYRCRGGEIDLVMQHRGELVFVEVRARSSSEHGGAAASITARKRARLVLAAQVFLQRYRKLPPCRFDVVAIDGDRLDWIKAAFGL
ncbi:MAG: YraN family protein [Paucimonas sp.]|nr:YraN family protein [Paucimonas sp.]